MIDKIPIKTLLDHAKQPFIPYTTAKSVMWDGTDKTLYDVVVEGVPLPEIPPIKYYDWDLQYTGNEEMVQEIYDAILQDIPVIVKSTVYKTLKYYDGASSYGNITCQPIFFGSKAKNSSGTEYCFLRMLPVTITSFNDSAANTCQGIGIGQIYFTLNDGKVTNTTLCNRSYYQVGAGVNLTSYGTSAGYTPQALSIKNTKAFTPTSDYHPATKKYVDDTITGALASYTPTVDLSNYYTKEEIDAELDERDTALNADIMVAINAAGRAEMEVQNKQNKVTYGTGDPSGGSDGDVYFKYTA